MGIGVMTWFSMTNVEDTLEYERLVKMGVDIICSNDSLFAKNSEIIILLLIMFNNWSFNFFIYFHYL